MPQNPFDNLTSLFGFPKPTLQSVQPTFPYQTSPPKPQAPTFVNPQGIGLPPGLGSQPLSNDPTRGLVAKDSDLMLQGLMQMMGQMQPPQAQAAPPGAPAPDDMEGPTGGDAADGGQPPQEVRDMQGEEQPQTSANLPPPGAPREPVPYIPSKRRG